MFLARTLFIFTVIFLNINLPTVAAPLSENTVPEPLKPWVEWVLQDDDTRGCPTLYNNDITLCVWPSVLDLSLDQQQGRFEQQWQVYKETSIRIPGDKKTWPQNVLLDGRAATVSQKDGFPTIKLPVGTHRIKGEFIWKKLPKSLAITPETGLVSLSLNGKVVANPEINQQGRLWLNSGQGKADERDSIVIEVYRKLMDSHPMQVVTQIDLRVSGKPRDIELDQALLDGFLPLRLDSKLPARIENSGKIRVQLRSGEWSITVFGRSNQPFTSLTLPTPSATTSNKWPKQEIWVFEAHNDLRLVQVQGVNSIDPRQTNLPNAWKSLPAYAMQADQIMQLKVIRRGDPQPEPDQLSLQRDMWLDFDGKGYTLRDQINGSMTQGWRLEARPELQLGRVLVDGDPQFITQLPNSTLKGVEVRRGTINMQAESRYQADHETLPISAWDHDFVSVNTTLHLPLGWKLFSAWGMDNTPNTWLQKWTLLDLFLVLIAALAVAYLWRWTWGLLALFTLVLIWHESGAPQFIWLNTLAAIALLRVLPEGRFQVLIRRYRNLSFVALLLIVLTFIVSEVRLGLYPQLENPWFSVDAEMNNMGASDAMESDDVANAMPQEEMLEASEPIAPAPMVKKRESYASKSLQSSSRYEQKNMPRKAKIQQQAIQEIDPEANIQTGPGLPNWRWNQVNLSWNGPVEKGETLDLVLISPTMNLILNLLRVVLVLVLLWRLLSQLSRIFGAGTGIKALSGKQSAVVNTFALVLFTSFLFAPISKLQAETIPSNEMLEALKQRLLEPTECLPNCAQIERLTLQIGKDSLQGRMKIHAATQTAVPLPGNAKIWLPNLILVDGEASSKLSRNSKGELWLAVSAGLHEVIFQGSLSKSSQLQLVLPLKPHYVDWNSEFWNVDGIQDNGVPSEQLQLNRVIDESAASGKKDQSAERGNNILPAFVRVERTLHLGLNWTVDTVVRRLSPKGTPIVMSIPLLDGESVLTDNLTLKNKAVRLSLSANQVIAQWQSRLDIKNDFTLTASKQVGFIETWKVETSPIWHVETSGIPVVHHQQNDGAWLPTWKPWAGESVKFVVSRPNGVAGQTLTINASKLDVKLGKRSNDVALDFSLRSSQGTQHTLTLPKSAALHRVSIDGKKQAIRQNGNTVTLPVSPGEQQIKLEWREPHSSAFVFQVSPIDLGTSSVNSQMHVQLADDRWVLLLGGPKLGPAVLFWGVILVILLVAIILGRSKLAPVKSWQWFLLGIGLSQTKPLLILVIVAWLVLLAMRKQFINVSSALKFNAVQVGYVLLTMVALTVLLNAVSQGLLGQPDMQIMGNNSYGNSLNWFQDRSGNSLAQPWILSVPLLVYRLLMLLWALWLAFALLGWLRWGWECLSEGGLWREWTFRKGNGKPSKSSTE